MKTLFIAALFCAAPAEARTNATLPAGSMIEAPPAPAIDGWRKVGEIVATREQITPVETKLGGRISALRDALYAVGAKKIEVNLIVPLDSGEGDRIFASLTKQKPAWSILRKPGVIYEFVAQNDAQPEVQKAREQLAK